MKLSETFDFVNGIPPAKGSILLSEPFLGDPDFERSVIVLCEYLPEETFGFVLNHKADAQLNDLIDIAPKDIPVYVGGPVANDSLFYIHTLKDIESSEEFLPGLYFGGDLTEIFECLSLNEANKEKIRFFIGYSGWSKGQLEQEIKERAWICVNNIPIKTILSKNTSNLWRKCMSQQGKQFQTFALFPKNITDN
jgi:putative transcriptional regulator